MKALILAAGLGSRLRPLTDEVPKCMVKVNGVSIIDKQIQNLKENGVRELFIVTGYKGDTLEKYIINKYSDLDIKILQNDIYDKTNNMYSLNMAKDYLNGKEFIMMNSDVFFEGEIIDSLIKSDYNNIIVCQPQNYNEESMKVIVNEGIVTHISKQINKCDAYGTSIDVYRFGEEASKQLFDIINIYLNIKKDMNSWSEVAIDDLLKVSKFKTLDTKHKWMEIDNHEDLKIAEEIFE